MVGRYRTKERGENRTHGYHQIFGYVSKGMLLTIARRDSEERCHRLAGLPAQFNNLVFLPPAVGFEAFMMGTP